MSRTLCQYQAAFLPVLCLAMAFWSNMEDTQSQNLYKKDDYFGSFLRNNREKVYIITITSEKESPNVFSSLGHEKKCDHCGCVLHPVFSVHHLLFILCHGQYCKFEQFWPVLNTLFCRHLQSISDGVAASHKDTHSLSRRVSIFHSDYLVPSLRFQSGHECVTNVLWYFRINVF